MDAKLERLALEQRRTPGRTVRRATAVIGKKGAILIGIGVLVGQLLGGAAAPIVQKIVALLIGVR